MASVANLAREERIGLGVAAAAHAALIAALVWQVRAIPAPPPVPERIEVSLSDEVGLTSTAPDPVPQAQAAVAPVLAPEPAPPAPAPEPIPTVAVKIEPHPTAEPIRQPPPKPVPAPRPVPQPMAKPVLAKVTPAKPAPAKTTAAKPAAAKPVAAKPAPAKPALARPAGGSRLGQDFLSGVSAGERTAVKGTPAAAFGPAEQASLSQAINRQLKPHWSAPQGVDAEQLVTVLSWELNPDGSLNGPPQVVSQSGITDSNRPQAKLHAERAIRAVQLAAPFDLPDEFYDKWKRVRSWRFDRKL